MSERSNRVCVVTGALGSIGRAICEGLARTGATVVMVVRDEPRAREARDEIVATTANARIEIVPCDLASLASVRHAAADLCRRYPRIHALVNNAATFSAERKTTADGLELQLGVNHLAHMLLTVLLEGPLFAAGDARVVVMGMPSKTPMRWDDLLLENGYDGMTAYGMSKAANLYFTRELAERWQGRVTVNAVDPGMIRTTLIREAPLPIRIVFALLAKAPAKGADTAIHLATAPELATTTGRFFAKRRETAFPKGSDKPEDWHRLWIESAKLVGLPTATA